MEDFENFVNQQLDLSAVQLKEKHKWLEDQRNDMVECIGNYSLAQAYYILNGMYSEGDRMAKHIVSLDKQLEAVIQQTLEVEKWMKLYERNRNPWRYYWNKLMRFLRIN